MLVLFPFYSQDKGTSKAPEVPPGIDPKNYEQAMARIQQLEDTVKQFQDYAAQLEAKMKRMSAESNEAQAEASQLREKNAQLRTRNPILVMASFNPQDGNQIQIAEDDNCPVPQGKQRPPVDPAKTQDPFWTGDRGIFGAAVATYLVRDAPPCQFKFFLKFIKHPATNPPMTGNVVVQTMDDFQISPVVYNTREQVAIPIAVVSVAGDLKQTVQLTVPKESTMPPGQSPAGK